MDLDEEPSYIKRNRLSHQVLKQVVIPASGRSSVASSLSSLHDHSGEYDTPGTSVVVTPAESLAKTKRSMNQSSRLSSSTSSCQPKQSLMGKRKRVELDELMEADALLAQDLQNQAYGGGQETASGPSRARNGPVGDSEESLISDLSREHSLDPDDFPKLDIPTYGRSNRGRSKALLSQMTSKEVGSGWSQKEPSDEDESPGIHVSRRKKIQTNHRTSLPSRAARDSANKSIRDRTSRGILDSEDPDLSDHSDDTSLFGPEIVSDASEDSELNDEEVGDVAGPANSLTTAMTVSTSSSAQMAVPATRRRGPGRRGVSSTQATNATRGRRPWQRRVEDRVSQRYIRSNIQD